MISTREPDEHVTFVGCHLLGFVPNYIPLPLLAALLLISAVKAWRHQ